MLSLGSALITISGTGDLSMTCGLAHIDRRMGRESRRDEASDDKAIQHVSK